MRHWHGRRALVAVCIGTAVAAPSAVATAAPSIGTEGRAEHAALAASARARAAHVCPAVAIAPRAPAAG